MRLNHYAALLTLTGLAVALIGWWSDYAFAFGSGLGVGGCVTGLLVERGWVR